MISVLDESEDGDVDDDYDLPDDMDPPKPSSTGT